MWQPISLGYCYSPWQVKNYFYRAAEVTLNSETGFISYNRTITWNWANCFCCLHLNLQGLNPMVVYESSEFLWYKEATLNKLECETTQSSKTNTRRSNINLLGYFSFPVPDRKTEQEKQWQQQANNKQNNGKNIH